MEDGKPENIQKESGTMETEENADVFGMHGGDPRLLELIRCLLITNLPNSLLGDDFEVFSECVIDMLVEDFKVARDAIEKIVRIPRLQSDPENAENAMRAIVQFKSRVHKHRVVAQKKVTGEGQCHVAAIDAIPKEFVVEVDEELEVADEVGDEGDEETHEEPQEQNEGDEHHDDEEEEEEEEAEQEPEHDENAKEAKEEADKEKTDKVAEPYKKKVYVDEDENVEYTTDWNGAPEFQWKLLSAANDSRRLVIENLFWCDLENVFIYRVMMKAETVDVSFPMRFNLDGTKIMYGKMTLTFQFGTQIMEEAMNHLIYFRSPGRRVKVFLPQTPQALKRKDEFESRLGRVIQPTLRMRQLVLKPLPSGLSFTTELATQSFGEGVADAEIMNDELGKPCGIVTMVDAAATIKAHSTTSMITFEGHEEKANVYLRGVEAHFGSFLTRYDRRKMTLSRPAVKRPSDSIRSDLKRPRGAAIRGSPSLRSSTFASRGGRGAAFRPSAPPFRGSGVPRGRGGPPLRGNRVPPFAAGRPTPSPRSVEPFQSLESQIRHQRKELEMQQSMLDNMAAQLRQKDRLSRSAFDLHGSTSYTPRDYAQPQAGGNRYGDVPSGSRSGYGGNGHNQRSSYSSGLHSSSGSSYDRRHSGRY